MRPWALAQGALVESQGAVIARLTQDVAALTAGAGRRRLQAADGSEGLGDLVGPKVPAPEAPPVNTSVYG
jgi:hypothetical protein